MKKQQRRIIMRIELPQRAIASYEAAGNDRGMKYIAMTSQIIEWFIQQSDEVQAAILGNHPAPPSHDELARMILEHIRDSQR